MTTSETALVDTNVLVYAADATSPFHHQSKQFRDKGLRGEIPLCIFPQIFSEFYAITTDPRRVANPWTQELKFRTPLEG
jgi:predicted nucleic acid-binding protein